MSLKEYLQHYIVWQDTLAFFGIALLGLIVSLVVILLFVKLISMSVAREYRKVAFSKRIENAVQRFYEMIFSGASILSFLAVYYLIDRFLDIPSYREFWDRYKDFLLLLMICLSIIVNNFMDRIIMPLKKISREERASVRIVGMIYVMLIFTYIKFIYENDNYDRFIMYFLGLMIGRFVYFDVSFREVVNTLKTALKQLPLMVLGLGYTAFMCYVGFGSKYLLISNGVLVSTFIAHIFMIAAIFLIYHSRVMCLFSRKADINR